MQKVDEAMKGPQLTGGDESAMSKTRDALRKETTVRIVIPSTETEKDAVTVGVNGYVYQIARDKPADVPASVAAVLDNAVTVRYTQRPRDNGEGMETIPVESMRFPYQRS